MVARQIAEPYDDPKVKNFRPILSIVKVAEYDPANATIETNILESAGDNELPASRKIVS